MKKTNKKSASSGTQNNVVPTAITTDDNPFASDIENQVITPEMEEIVFDVREIGLVGEGTVHLRTGRDKYVGGSTVKYIFFNINLTHVSILIFIHQNRT